jgi:GntR family transcriptional repressor for pyruvate dehydrogenase complex
MGLVRTAVGSGPESGAVIVARPDVAIGTALSMHLATSHLPVGDIVETRVLLESWAATTAASHFDEANCVRLAGLLDAMDDVRLSPEEFHRLDVGFHLALTELPGNVVISAIMTSLRESIRGYVMEGVNALPDWPAMARRLRREHRGILRAMREREGDRAAQLVRRHIEGFHRAAMR